MHYVTFVCETCDTEYTVEGSMEMPPYWMGIQIVIAGNFGHIPNHEQENYQHFCSDTCIIEYLQSKDFRRRKVLVDKEDKDKDKDTDER